MVFKKNCQFKNIKPTFVGGFLKGPAPLPKTSVPKSILSPWYSN